MDLCFAVHKLPKFSSNTGKVNFEGLVQLLRYITDNKNSRLKYYANIEDEPLSDLLRQNIIKTDNQLMVFSDSIWKDRPYTFISTVEYIVFYEGGLIDNCTHIPGPVDKFSSESEYNA